MKKLKTILQSKILYYFLLLLALITYLITNNLNHISTYNSFNNEKFIITNITKKDYGYKLDLKGKEKVIGYIYENNNISFTNYNLGDKVKITGTTTDITNNTVPNTFNYKKYLASNKIYNVIEITNITKEENNKNIFYSIKDKLLKRGKKLKKSYPYINSLIFGNNNYIEEDILNTYRENGISHLFAISGLHISIFIGILGYMLEKIKTPFVIKSLTLILFLLFYMFLTNFSMSVMRGAILTILLLLNKLLKLEIPTTNLLLLTLSIILFNNPLNLNNVGLEYSFLVTLFLMKYTNIIKGNKIKTLFIISFIAFLVSYPITINNFNQVNFLSIIYNIFFVPYVSSILLPFTMISYIFPFLDNFLYILIKIIETSSHFLNSIEILKISMCKMNILMITIYFVIICKLFNKWNTKRKKYLILTLIFFIIHFFIPIKSNNYILFIDVGQGDSTFISMNNKYTLIDTGGLVSYNNEEYKYKIAKNKLIPYFKSKGIRKIHNLILTHGDGDHMKEAYYLVENFKVEKVIFNCGEFNELEQELIKTLDKKKIPYYSCIKKLNIDDNKLYFLNNKDYGNENDNSNVIYTEINNHKFLIMGDAGVKVEEDLIKKYNLQDIDVLKVGPHGSKTSSSKSFIDKLNLKYSIISVGKNNRYGHPNNEVLENLKNTKVYRTDQDGSIMFKINNKKLNIKSYKP